MKRSWVPSADQVMSVPYWEGWARRCESWKRGRRKRKVRKEVFLGTQTGRRKKVASTAAMTTRANFFLMKDVL